MPPTFHGLLAALLLASIAAVSGATDNTTSPQKLTGVPLHEGYDVNIAYWTFDPGPVAITRLDPIMNPNAVGAHVHAVAGGSRFGKTYDPDTLMSSKCSTINVQGDKSNYWMPSLYHKIDKTGEYVLTPILKFAVYYQFRTGDDVTEIFPFPKGLKMYAGDNTRNSFNESSFSDKAFPTTPCSGGIRLQVYFPSCGTGAPDSPDHQSHLAYPIDEYNRGRCPPSHPYKYLGVFLEMHVDSQRVVAEHGPGKHVLANGDTVGYSLHADFTNGWDPELLVQALDQCQAAHGSQQNCAPFNATRDDAAAGACTLEPPGELEEDVGAESPIARLPGCNLEWVNGTKPACDEGEPASLPRVPPTLLSTLPAPSREEDGEGSTGAGNSSTQTEGTHTKTCGSRHRKEMRRRALRLGGL